MGDDIAIIASIRLAGVESGEINLIRECPACLHTSFLSLKYFVSGN